MNVASRRNEDGKQQEEISHSNNNNNSNNRMKRFLTNITPPIRRRCNILRNRRIIQKNNNNINYIRKQNYVKIQHFNNNNNHVKYLKNKHNRYMKHFYVPARFRGNLIHEEREKKMEKERGKKEEEERKKKMEEEEEEDETDSEEEEEEFFDNEEENRDFQFVNEKYWEKRVFLQTEIEYFFNYKTNEIIPMTHDDEEHSEHPLKLHEYKPVIVTLQRGGEDVQRELRFKEYKNLKDDRPYYLNCATLETTWKFPFENQEIVLEIPQLPEYEFKHILPSNFPTAPLWKRTVAAMIDLGVSTIVATGVVGMMYFELGDGELYTVIPAFGPLLLGTFTGRDCVMDNGSRSIGKKVMGLEIILADKYKFQGSELVNVGGGGLIPSRGHNVLRNIYVPPLLVAGVFFQPILYIFGVELALFVIKGRKIGDFLGRTKVIEEAEDRPMRLKERKEYVDREVRMT